MNRMTSISSTRVRRLVLLLVTLTAAVAGADWTYQYSDDFSSDKAENESYLHSMFWPDEVNPLARPYLYYTTTTGSRGLAFAEYKGQLAELGYNFPIGEPQARRMVKGTLQIDVSFAAGTFSWPGQLFYSVSTDGAAWSPRAVLAAGRNEVQISSPEGMCYVLFSGNEVVVDNLRISLFSPAATIRIPQDFPSIQRAIDAAGPGDIIEVARGTYTGLGNWDIDFRGKAITVRSAEGPQSTIIDCGKPTASSGRGRRGFYFHRGETADSVLSGFTIRGGRVYGTTIPSNAALWTNSVSHPLGGGIYCESSSPSIINCIIEDCGAELGGGIGIFGGAPVISDCTVEACLAGGLNSATSGGRGAGIAVVGHADATIANTVIQGNTAYRNSYGAGLYVLQSAATIDGCLIADNVASSSVRGGGAYVAGDAADVTFSNCIISENVADAGAGILAERTVTANPSFSTSGPRCWVAVINCTVAHNRLSGSSASATTAGGIQSTGTDIMVQNSIVWYNNGTSVVITDPSSKSPVTYSNIQRGYGGEGNIDDDPLFASTTAPDYHLRSRFGRYDPLWEKWVTDGSQSPCIDAGDPRLPVGEEPPPNGNRLNMGAYGGTRQASKGTDNFIYHVDAQMGRDWNNGLSRAWAFATLQRAIDAARDGDTVLVWPGVYTEEVTFDRKAITVQSAGDAPVVTAPGSYAFSFYGAESSLSVLKNFVITGCGEGGIFCEGASPTLKNLTIAGNRFGITSYSGADPDIINCIVWDNAGGALFQCKARYSCLQQSDPDRAAGNINANPLFADPKNGDYHVKSQYGRYVPQTDKWVNDSVTSPCIDAGDPTEDPREEPPHGGRINMGAYGGTAYASKSSGLVK